MRYIFAPCCKGSDTINPHKNNEMNILTTVQATQKEIEGKYGMDTGWGVFLAGKDVYINKIKSSNGVIETFDITTVDSDTQIQDVPAGMFNVKKS